MTPRVIVVLAAALLGGCIPDPKQGGVGSQGPTAPPVSGGVVYRPNFGFQANLSGCPCPDDGGSVTLLRSDTTVPWLLELPLNAVPGRMYWISRQISPGTYQVTYTPPVGFQLLYNEPASQRVIVTADLQWTMVDIGPK